MDHRPLTVKRCLLSNVKKEYAPGPFAGRGGVSWCHLLLPPPPSAPPPIRWEKFLCQPNSFIEFGGGEWGLGGRCNGRSRLSYGLCITSPCESNLPSIWLSPLRARVKWISLFPRPSRTHRWLSAQLNSYLSSRCFIGRDYTLPQEGVKQANSYIIDQSKSDGENIYDISNAGLSKN
jgi:hypothetical protein